LTKREGRLTRFYGQRASETAAANNCDLRPKKKEGEGGIDCRGEKSGRFLAMMRSEIAVCPLGGERLGDAS